MDTRKRGGGDGPGGFLLLTDKVLVEGERAPELVLSFLVKITGENETFTDSTTFPLGLKHGGTQSFITALQLSKMIQHIKVMIKPQIQILIAFLDSFT